MSSSSRGSTRLREPHRRGGVDRALLAAL